MTWYNCPVKAATYILYRLQLWLGNFLQRIRCLLRIRLLTGGKLLRELLACAIPSALVVLILRVCFPFFSWTLAVYISSHLWRGPPLSAAWNEARVYLYCRKVKRVLFSDFHQSLSLPVDRLSWGGLWISETESVSNTFGCELPAMF